MTSRTSFAGFLSFSFMLMNLYNQPAEAGPRYIAIPIDNVDVIELNPISPNAYTAQSSPAVAAAAAAAAASVSSPVSYNSRLPRHSETYMPIAMSTLHHHNGEPVIEQPVRAERSATAAHILDYVDFGAHTGPNGAFSWYADYPSHH